MTKTTGQSGARDSLLCVPLFTASLNFHMLISESLGTAAEILTDGYCTDTFIAMTTLG